MTVKTHLLSSLIIGEAILFTSESFGILDNFDKTQVYYYIASIMVGTMLPDIDEPRSKISRIVPKFVSSFFESATKHRGFTHNIFGVSLILLASVVAIFLGVNTFVVFGFVIGYLSHIFVGDMTSYSGVEFIPGKVVRIPVFGGFRVGTSEERVVYSGFLLLQLALSVLIFNKILS